MSFDPAERTAAFLAAIDAMDFSTVETFFAEDATFGSRAVGGLSGRDAIMAAFRRYFEDYPDQKCIDSRVEALSSHSARAVWSIRATHSRTGQPLVREGEETVTFDDDGRVVSVVVTDYQDF
ncbi:nuclear transport factor 2 family protein [Rhizobiaceae bacterium n13]|uniref:Nuclear transport factor 2 family protein n=1 Tax=Ferirhizobium litorale TaxID=2927786 RepID=A0AAE3TZZ9_9HYPH|nr:nuclear transport factor 2 family protein [Fererhizobium litorale]MDI7861402.1 nuclear transport factor 2 family protein [Fererhizobium litorale]MDI7921549.1 nuclear transport factor 2 family protein [Fererhizobium litorale]